MAIPTSGYDSATISNPTSALTDFTLIVDLSRMTSNWWSGCNTTTGGYGRACKSDGTTELACDFIDVNTTASTGLLRVKWTGTLASTGTQTIRVFPPNTANTLYSASDTYGSDNAYDSSWEAYYPLFDLNDRTSNSHDLTLEGDAARQTGTGYYGGEIDLDGTGDYASTGDTFSITNYTVITTHKASWNYWGGPVPQILRNGGSAIDGISDNLITMRGDSYSGTPRVGVSDSTHRIGDSSQWNFLASGISEASDDGFIYLNGSNLTVVHDGTFPMTAVDGIIQLGSSSLDSYYATGLIGATSFHSTYRSSDWISEEYDQTNDNATFWGTWTWTSGGGSSSIITLVMNHLRRLR